MKTIELDGKKYVELEAYEQLKTKKEKEKPEFNILNGDENKYMDESLVMMLGSCKLEGNWVRTRVSVNYLKRAVKMMEQMHESVDIVFANDMPIVFGRINEKTGEANGLVIAPRVEN